jgi:cytochrome b561
VKRARARDASRSDYTQTAKILHWLMAVLLTAMFAMGFYMQDLPLSPQKLQLYSWHKWAGFSALVLAVTRLVWRLTHKPPAMPAGMSKWMRRAAYSAHLLIYALMIAIPVSGWLMSSALGFQTVWFGVLPVPDLLERDRALGESLAVVHKCLNVLFVTVLAAHVAAALKHQVVDKYDTLRRILPAKPSAKASRT